MDILLGSLVSGLLLGLVLALVALGLTIIFGVMDIVNFAHGEFLMVGMYAGLLTAQATGLDPLFTLPVAAAGLIADRRELYNDQVYRYNARIAQFPGLILAALFGWRARPFFEATDADRVRPPTDLTAAS